MFSTRPLPPEWPPWMCYKVDMAGGTGGLCFDYNSLLRNLSFGIFIIALIWVLIKISNPNSQTNNFLDLLPQRFAKFTACSTLILCQEHSKKLVK